MKYKNIVIIHLQLGGKRKKDKNTLQVNGDQQLNYPFKSVFVIFHQTEKNSKCRKS